MAYKYAILIVEQNGNVPLKYATTLNNARKTCVKQVKAGAKGAEIFQQKTPMTWTTASIGSVMRHHGSIVYRTDDMRKRQDGTTYISSGYKYMEIKSDGSLGRRIGGSEYPVIR